MQKTKIPWCDYTCNPAVGCSLPLVSSGCAHCYARELHNDRHELYKAGKTGLPKQYAKPFEQVQLFPDRLNDPIKLKKPATIFVGSMTDLFGDDVPFEFLDKAFNKMKEAKRHDYYILTKRPKRMAKYINRLKTILEKERHREEYIVQDCFHLGVSICNQEEADRILPIALQIPGFDFVSFEPLLGPIVIPEQYLLSCIDCGNRGSGPMFDWRPPGNGNSLCRDVCIKRGEGPSIKKVIIGCESGPERRPCKREWIQDLVNQCKAADVKYMIKQMEIDGTVCKDPEKCERELK